MLYFLAGAIAGVLIAIAIASVIRGARVKQTGITCRADQWTTIVSNFGTGMPRDIEVEVVDPTGARVAGTYLEHRYLWVFPTDPIEGELRGRMRFHRDWINAIYRIRVLPSSDVEVTVT